MCHRKTCYLALRLKYGSAQVCSATETSKKTEILHVDSLAIIQPESENDSIVTEETGWMGRLVCTFVAHME